VTIKDFNGIDGEFRSWQLGGTIINTTEQFPVGQTRSYKISFRLNDYCFYEQKFSLNAGQKLAFNIHFRKDTAMAYLPRLWIYENETDPIADANDLLYEKVMSDSIDTWETYACEFENPSAYPKSYTMTIIGKNTDGILYFLPEMDESSGGGVSRSRIIGGV
jgi:hypothetical protein